MDATGSTIAMAPTRIVDAGEEHGTHAVLWAERRCGRSGIRGSPACAGEPLFICVRVAWLSKREASAIVSPIQRVGNSPSRPCPRHSQPAGRVPGSRRWPDSVPDSVRRATPTMRGRTLRFPWPSAVALFRLPRRTEAISRAATSAITAIVGKIDGATCQQDGGSEKQKSEFAHLADLQMKR